MNEKDVLLDATTGAMEAGISLCETEEDHEALDVVLKRWRSRFEMLIEENTRAVGKLKAARRAAAP